MIEEFDLDKYIDDLGLIMINSIKTAIKNKEFDKKMGVQMELKDGTIYQFPFKVIKTDREHYHETEVDL